jgi:predicted nucleotidyltransferase
MPNNKTDMPEFTITGPGNLLQRISAALRDLPGASELHLFGSLADGTADAYSDIDLEVTTRDLAASASALADVLTTVAPIEVDWQLPTPEDEVVRTILFRGEAYYYKLDISLRAFGQIHNGASDVRKSRVRLWHVEPHAFSGQGKSNYVCAPRPGTPGHFVVGQLLGGVRYVKARKRGQDWTCWRFASAQVDWLATMLWGRSRNWSDPGKKLTTWEYIELDAAMRDDKGRMPLSAWDFSTPAAMDDGFCRLLERTIALAREKAENMGKSIPLDLAESLMRFIRVELGRA